MDNKLHAPALVALSLALGTAEHTLGAIMEIPLMWPLKRPAFSFSAGVPMRIFQRSHCECYVSLRTMRSPHSLAQCRLVVSPFESFVLGNDMTERMQAWAMTTQLHEKQGLGLLAPRERSSGFQPHSDKARCPDRTVPASTTIMAAESSWASQRGNNQHDATHRCDAQMPRTHTHKHKRQTNVLLPELKRRLPAFASPWISKPGMQTLIPPPPLRSWSQKTKDG